MPTKTFDVNLDLMNSEYQLIDGIEVVSGDTEANVFNVNLLKDYQPVNVTGNTAVIVFLKPDNTTVYQNLTLVDAAAGKFTCTLSSQTIVIPGKVRAEVILYEGTKRLTSTRFEFIVRKSLLNENTVESSNEFTALTEALGTVNQYDSRITTVEQDQAAHEADFMPHGVDNAGFHNSIYRGKFLGNEVTTAQYNAISSGAFEDLYIGDYWTIGGINWRIAAFNYYRNTGNTLVPGNHVVIVPDTSLYSHVMNDTDTTEGGYTGSKMYTEGLEQAKTIINTAFSGHVVTFRAYLCNAVVDGQASGAAWVDSTVDLMNEIMVYGSVVNGTSTYGLYNIGSEKSQLPLFSLNPQSINTRYPYWLRDIASASHFACVLDIGLAYRLTASSSYAVRPRFLIS